MMRGKSQLIAARNGSEIFYEPKCNRSVTFEKRFFQNSTRTIAWVIVEIICVGIKYNYVL